jgi:hypothetical protein
MVQCAGHVAWAEETMNSYIIFAGDVLETCNFEDKAVDKMAGYVISGVVTTFYVMLPFN